MTDRRILPGAQAQLIDKAGRATPPFYDFMRRLTGETSPIPPEIANASFVTLNNDTSVLPNSVHLAAGANITLTMSGASLSIAAQVPGAGDGYPAQLGYAGI